MLVDLSRAEVLVFRLSRQERDVWVTWPAQVSSADGRAGGGKGGKAIGQTIFDRGRDPAEISVLPAALKWRQTESPSSPGIMSSSTIRSNWAIIKAAPIAAAFAAGVARMLFFHRYFAHASRISRRSSTIRIWGGLCVIIFPDLNPNRSNCPSAQDLLANRRKPSPCDGLIQKSRPADKPVGHLPPKLATSQT